jgi:hypothetical protein
MYFLWYLGFRSGRNYLLITLLRLEFLVLALFVIICHNSVHYSLSSLSFKTQLDSVCLFAQVNPIYRFVMMVY